MNIPDELLEKWKVLYTPGDSLKMAEQMKEKLPRLKSNYEYFNRAMRDKKCNDTIFKIMADFFEAKAEMIKEYL